jgi:putative ABC transport system permease protein
MLRNYLKTAFRAMLRQKVYSAINIIGLSLGIAVSLMIMLYIADEINFDRFHQDAARIYRVGFSGRLQGNDFRTAESQAPVAAALMAEAPGVESAVRFGMWKTMPVRFGEKAFTEDYMLVADSNFFTFFSFPLTQGDPATVLKGMNKLVISESAAKRYFGNDNPIGKILLRGSDKVACEVTGVAKDSPANSHIRFDMVLSGESWDYLRSNVQWTSNNSYTYFKILPATHIADVEAVIHRMEEVHIGPELEKFTGLSLAQFRKAGNDVGMFIQPMLGIHLDSNLSDEIQPNGNLQYLYVFGAVAAFIVLIACINFMNLSTARSANRAKEVGVRKTIGAFRTKLIGQFISESMLYSFFSTALAMLIIAAMMHTFNTIAGKSLTIFTLLNPWVVGGIVLFALFVGLLAGSYPAFYLTAFNPVDVLKGKIRSGFRNSGLRNGLVVFQFMISIGLIVGSLVVYRQLNYMLDKNLGFDKESVVRLLHTWSLGDKAKAFKAELRTHPEFAGASYASDLPGHIRWTSVYRKGGTDQDFLLSVCMVDQDHLEAMKYTLVAGRFFSRDFGSDSAAVVINEATFRQMGFKTIENEFIYDYNGEKRKPMHIIGIVKDFNFESLRSDIKPLIFRLGGEPNGAMAVRFSKGNVRERVALLETIWKKYSTDAFQYSFLDDDFNALFQSEQRTGTLILILTVLTIAIACLGLFGLATFVGEQRAKEISIRKVMGASVSQIMRLLFRDFTILVIIAFVIAAPLGGYFMHLWLQGFAYRTPIDVSIFLIAGGSAIALAVLTISYQSIRAARANPVVALKAE